MRLAAVILSALVLAITSRADENDALLLLVAATSAPPSSVTPMFQFRGADTVNGINTQIVANVGAYTLDSPAGYIAWATNGAVLLDRTNYLALSTAIQLTTNMCILQVVKFDGVGVRRIMLGTGYNTYCTPGYAHTDNETYMNLGGSSWEQVGWSMTNNGIWFLMTSIRDSTSQWIRVNGQQVGNRIAASNITSYFNHVGRRPSYFNGTNAWFKEIVGYTNANASSAEFYEAREAELNAAYSIY